MNESLQHSDSWRRLLQSVFYLAAIAALAAAVLSFVAEQTGDDIARNKALYATRMLAEVLPDADYDIVPGLDYVLLQDELLGSSQALQAYIAYRDGEPAAIALNVIAPGGYVAPIHLLVGITANGQIAGVRASEHRETPGLGDKIDAGKDVWIQRLTGESLNDANFDSWAVRRDGGRFDQITGATITSRAVVKAVRQALEYYAAHPDIAATTEVANATDQTRQSE